MAKGKKKEKKKKGGMLTTLMLLVISLALVVTVQLTVVFVVVMLLPSIVAFYCDAMDGKQTFHTVFACNVSGLLPFLMDIVMMGNGTSMMMSKFEDTLVWLVVYASAGFGWILVWGCPKLAYVMIHSSHMAQVRHLQNTQSQLVDEWGGDIKHVHDT